MCIVKFQYATSIMLALPYDHCLVSLLFLDVPITVIVPSLLLTSFLNVFNFICTSKYKVFTKMMLEVGMALFTNTSAKSKQDVLII